MRGAGKRTPLVILLVTPTHTKSLDDQDSFVPNLLSRIFPIKKGKVDIVAAVVDQIPYPPNCYPLPNVPEWRLGPNGFEGYSVAVAYSENTAPDLWSQRNVREASALESVLQRPVLSFRFPSHEHLACVGTRSQPVKSSTLHLVQLPVANTLFYNSQPATMFASCWTASVDSKNELVYKCDKKINLARQTLNMAGRFSNQNLRLSKLLLELQPLTIPRIIAAGLGNIIRELHVGRKSTETIPASQELEHAVSQKFQHLESPDQRPGVWALITPRTKWIAEPQIGTSDVAHWIERGSRLHRILSGGGGWGAKKGLLALDPETDFDSPQPKTDQTLEDSQFSDGSPGQELEGVFQPGDIVTFFHSRALPPNECEQRLGLRSNDWYIKSPPSVCFGSASQPADTLTQQSTVIREENPIFQRILVKGYFGMLSERGMHYRVDRKVPTSSIEPFGTVVNTKIDNPDARLSIMGRRRPEVYPITYAGRAVPTLGETGFKLIRRVTGPPQPN